MENLFPKKLRYPPVIRNKMIQDHIKGLKTTAMLSLEYGLTSSNILKMVSRFKKKNATPSPINHSPVITVSIKKATSEDVLLRQENESLRKQLRLAHLKLDGYKIVGDILEEQYGIDLLKKALSYKEK